MNVVHHYLSLVIFTAAFIAGVQLPSFMDQYTKRVDAHLIEVEDHLSGYQNTADIYHGGDIEVLIQKHSNSSDPSFRSETAVIEGLVSNHRRYIAEQKAIEGGLLSASFHVMFFGDRQIKEEVLNSYTATMPLTTNAISTGLILALLVSMVLELLWVTLRIPGKRMSAIKAHG